MRQILRDRAVGRRGSPTCAGSSRRLQSRWAATPCPPCPPPPNTPPARRAAPDDRDDRVARPGRTRHRAHRRQGRLRRGRVARRSRGDHYAEAQADVRNRARRFDRQTQRGARAAAVPAFRRLRRLLAAALRRRRAGRGQATRARGRLVAYRPRPAGANAAAHPRAGMGIPAPRPPFGPPRREEGRRADRLPRAQIELRRGHDFLCRAAAQDLGPAAETARPHRRADGARPVAADRARGG